MFRKLLIIACLFGVAFSGYAQKRKKQREAKVTEGGIDYKKPGSPMPEVRFFRRDGQYVTNKDLENDANLVVMLFNPLCDHCEDQARALKDNIFLFKKSKLVLAAGPALVPHLDYFVNNVKIKEYPSIQVTADSSGFIDKVFNYTEIPQINIYDKERKLLRTFNGLTPIDTLKKYIE